MRAAHQRSLWNRVSPEGAFWACAGAPFATPLDRRIPVIAPPGGLPEGPVRRWRQTRRRSATPGRGGGCEPSVPAVACGDRRATVCDAFRVGRWSLAKPFLLAPRRAVPEGDTEGSQGWSAFCDTPGTPRRKASAPPEGCPMLAPCWSDRDSTCLSRRAPEARQHRSSSLQQGAKLPRASRGMRSLTLAFRAVYHPQPSLLGDRSMVGQAALNR